MSPISHISWRQMYEALLVLRAPQSGLEIYRVVPCRNGIHPTLSILTGMKTIASITATASPDV